MDSETLNTLGSIWLGCVLVAVFMYWFNVGGKYSEQYAILLALGGPIGAVLIVVLVFLQTFFSVIESN